ncbi:MAG TPA: hypothetical protein VH022_14395 [Candidatus Acidoferrum sp.]|jgi:hypothetical protein|nr:hypothetical protein [Candidatus Acidoferrum sp.]
MTTKQQFVDQARKYLGVDHRHQGRAHLAGRGQAVDCVGLLVCVAEDLELVDVNGQPFRRHDELNYGPQPTRDDVDAACRARLILKDAPPAPGDIVTLLVRYRENEPGVTCHVAVISDLGKGELGMIHALASLGRVVEHRLDPKWTKRIRGIFEVPGLE